MASVIVGTGIARPPHVVDNHALARIMDTTDEWIRSRTGVVSRRFAEPGTAASGLGAEAAVAALSDAEASPCDVDAVVCATMTRPTRPQVLRRNTTTGGGRTAVVPLMR